MKPAQKKEIKDAIIQFSNSLHTWDDIVDDEYIDDHMEPVFRIIQRIINENKKLSDADIVRLFCDVFQRRVHHKEAEKMSKIHQRYDYKFRE